MSPSLPPRGAGASHVPTLDPVTENRSVCDCSSITEMLQTV